MPDIPVVWHSYHEQTPTRGYWDEGLLEALFANHISPSGYTFVHYDRLENLPTLYDGAVVIIPAPYHANDIARFNEDLAGLRWVLFIAAGDEEGKFPLRDLDHPRMMRWLAYPHLERGREALGADRYIACGWPADCPEILESFGFSNVRPYKYFFAGQVTHERRVLCVEQLRGSSDGKLVETAGFAQGEPHDEYYADMARAVAVPCPSGPASVDTFRVYEALEAGCVPIVDDRTPATEPSDYWRQLFPIGNVPFPVVEHDWRELPQLLADVQYPADNNRCSAWWQQYKHQYVSDVRSDLLRLSGLVPVNEAISVLIPTSPIPSHPSTEIIEDTVRSVRERLPDAPIFLMIDGIRSEQQDRQAAYGEYTRRLLSLTSHVWWNVRPVLFDTHQHQANMTRQTLRGVRSPTILFVEHDTPLCEDIPFDQMVEIVESGDADVIRLMHEAHILEPHRPLMFDDEPIPVRGVPMIRTKQWSQRPHLASTEFYRRILDRHFGADSRTMIEDRMHSVVQVAANEGHWDDYKVMIYAPPGDMKRSLHSDGRGDDEKFDMFYGTGHW